MFVTCRCQVSGHVGTSADRS